VSARWPKKKRRGNEKNAPTSIRGKKEVAGEKRKEEDKRYGHQLPRKRKKGREEEKRLFNYRHGKRSLEGEGKVLSSYWWGERRRGR